MGGYLGTATLHIMKIFLTCKYGIYKTRIKTKPEMHVIDMIRGFLHNLQKSLSQPIVTWYIVK